MQLWFSNPRARSTVRGTPTAGGSAAGAGATDDRASAGGARDLHRSLPGYAPTPLVDLPALAAELGFAQVLVKDESSRLGLPAFKALGASWACRQVLERSPGAELVTATDGNHGRAVARMAAQLGTTSTVFVPAVMPTGTAALSGTRVMSVEPDSAACVLTSLVAGEPRSVQTADTLMAGLNCGTMSSLAWPALRDGLSAAVTVTDEEALHASDDLARLGVTSGPCGAATLAGARAALGDPGRRHDLDLDDRAVVVLLSTEGSSAA